MVNVQSPQVSEAVARYLALDAGQAPDKFNVLPAVLPVFPIPFPFYGYSCELKAGLGADADITVVTVPKDEDWLWTGFSTTHSAGDGGIDYVYIIPPDGAFYPRKAASLKIYVYGGVGVAGDVS